MTVPPTPRTFTLDEARALVPALLDHAQRIIELRADLATAQAGRRRGDEPPGGLAELKSLEAHLQEHVDWFAAEGVQLKGIAPLIADFPGSLDGRDVLLCWLEGETAIEWYHPAHTGFMGRRPLPGSHPGGTDRG